MAKTFYTHADIQDLVSSGVTMLRVTDDTVLTLMAKDTARKLGLQLVYDSPDAEAAPHRAPVRVPPDEPLEARVKSAAQGQLGPAADADLVAAIVRRVMAELGSK
ncbi:MAG: hypothetical protein ACE5FI_01850 [Anaerolineales bacterium]